jgi:hypothetical protein
VMSEVCQYCHGRLGEGATKCANCGAAPAPAEPPDFRYCPHCRRRLVALGSPACNYCGKALPENFLKAREAMWQRINDARAGRASEEELKELEDSGDDALRRALRSLFDLNDRTRRE